MALLLELEVLLGLVHRRVVVALHAVVHALAHALVHSLVHRLVIIALHAMVHALRDPLGKALGETLLGKRTGLQGWWELGEGVGGEVASDDSRGLLVLLESLALLFEHMLGEEVSFAFRSLALAKEEHGVLDLFLESRVKREGVVRSGRGIHIFAIQNIGLPFLGRNF